MPALSFSRRELQIIEGLDKGRSAKQLAEKGNDKEETVRAHVDDLQRKLGAETQADIPQRFRDMTGWSHKPTEYA
jgi:DNA-binding NarL/FixJ family response regulator